MADPAPDEPTLAGAGEFGSNRMWGLKELPAPEPIPWTPETGGWLALLGVLLVLLGWAALRLRQRRARQRYRRVALARVGAMAREEAPLEELPAVLRAAALQAFPREEVAPLHGDAWVAWLNEHGGGFSSDAAAALDRLPYDPGLGLDAAAREALLRASRGFCEVIVLAIEWPWAFALLPLPLLVAWLAPAYRDESEAVRAPFFGRLVELTGTLPRPGAVVVRKRAWQKLYHVVGWGLVVLALARPVWLGEPIVQERPARDLLLIVDLSGSMEEADFQGPDDTRVTRLDAVKQVLHEFIERREHDRLGLALFGNAAFLQAPFTEDRAVVGALLEELQPRMAGPRTMIGDAIGLAVRLFEHSDKKNKVVILLTDGNDTGSKMPVGRAAEIAAEEGITIHTIAMGDPTTVGEQALDTETLEGISKTSGGQFFLALDRGQLESIYQELDRLEPEQIDTLSYRPERSLHWVPLAALLVFGVLLFNVMTRIPRFANA